MYHQLTRDKLRGEAMIKKVLHLCWCFSKLDLEHCNDFCVFCFSVQ